MAKKAAHWTERSDDDLRYALASEFVQAVRERLSATRCSQGRLAKKMGVTKGFVSRLLSNPGNLTLKTMVRMAKAAGLSLSFVAHDAVEGRGPISPAVFKACWEAAGAPADMWGMPGKNPADHAAT